MSEQKYVAVHESKDGYWTIASKPTTKENAKALLSDGGVPKNEIGKVVTLSEALAHKKVLGKEYLQESPSIYDGGKYNKEQVKNIILNEGLIYAVTNFMDWKAIDKSEVALVKNWAESSRAIDSFEEFILKEHSNSKGLAYNNKTGYVIIVDPPYERVSVSKLSIKAQREVKIINSLLMRILKHVGLNENEFGEKFNSGGEIDEAKYRLLYAKDFSPHKVKYYEERLKELQSKTDYANITGVADKLRSGEMFSKYGLEIVTNVPTKKEADAHEERLSKTEFTPVVLEENGTWYIFTKKKFARGGKTGQKEMTRDKSFYKELPVIDGHKWAGFWDGYHHFVKKEESGIHKGKFTEVRATDEDIDNKNLDSMIEYGVTKENGGRAGDKNDEGFKRALTLMQKAKDRGDFNDEVFIILDEDGNNTGGHEGTVAHKSHAYKLGDKYRSDFDIDGMLEVGAKSDIGMGYVALHQLYSSFESMNYATAAAPLWDAIQELKAGNKEKAEEKLKEFHELVWEEMGEMMEKGGSTATPVSIFDITNVKEFVAKLKDEIKAPYVNAYFSTLGGEDRVSILLTISMEEKSEWSNGILENSKYSKFHLHKNGTVEQITRSHKLRENKFRKIKVKTQQQIIDKINNYLLNDCGCNHTPKFVSGGSLSKVWNFGERGITSFKNLIDGGAFESKFTSEESVVKFNRTKYNRMDGFAQKEYEARMAKKKTTYNLKYKGEDGVHATVSKEVYDYANVPVIEKMESGGVLDAATQNILHSIYERTKEDGLYFPSDRAVKLNIFKSTNGELFYGLETAALYEYEGENYIYNKDFNYVGAFNNVKMPVVKTVKLDKSDFTEMPTQSHDWEKNHQKLNFGGVVLPSVEGKSAQEWWDALELKQQQRFLIDNFKQLNGVSMNNTQKELAETSLQKGEGVKLLWSDFERFHKKHSDEIRNLIEGHIEGKYKSGGAIPNNYDRKETYEAIDVWGAWTGEQKHHFLSDHYNKIIELEKFRLHPDKIVLQRGINPLIDLSYDDLPEEVRSVLVEHLITGQYKGGGNVSGFLFSIGDTVKVPQWDGGKLKKYPFKIDDRFEKEQSDGSIAYFYWLVATEWEGGKMMYDQENLLEYGNKPKIKGSAGSNNAKLLIIDSKNPLSTQLQKETGDSLNNIDYSDIGVGNFNIVTHKKSGKKFVVYPKRVYDELNDAARKDDISYLKNVEKVEFESGGTVQVDNNGEWYVGEKETSTATPYYLFVNLDERGEYSADVRDADDNSIFDIDTETAHSMIEDGFLKAKPNEDIEGLEKYLKEMGVISDDATLKSAREFRRGGKPEFTSTKDFWEWQMEGKDGFVIYVTPKNKSFKPHVWIEGGIFVEKKDAEFQKNQLQSSKMYSDIKILSSDEAKKYKHGGKPEKHICTLK